MKRIYVGNVSFKTDDEALKKAFEEFGTVVSASLVKDKNTQMSKGFGFVEMEDDEEAAKAISSLSGSILDGRKIRVSLANDR